MARIRSLRPNVSRDEAIDQFSSGGPVELLRQVAFGPVRSVAEFFIPFRLFQVEILNSGKRDQRVLGLDAVRRRIEGAKVRNLLQAWLTSISKPI